MAEISVHAVVLRRRVQGESDRRLTLFTREQGKMDVYARGASKSGSRLAGVSEPLCESHLHLAVGPRNTYVTQAIPVRSFPELRSDYQRLSLGIALAELYEAVGVQAGDGATLFDHLIVSLTYLSHVEDPVPAFIWSCLRLMDLEGLSPSWHRCVETGDPIRENPAWVSPSGGGYFSIGSHHEQPDRFQVRAEVLLGLAKLVQLEVPPPKIKHARDTMITLYNFWLAFAHKQLPAYRNILESWEGVSF